MLARIHSSATIGIDAHPILVEVDIALGLPGFSTVGLPDNAVKESKDRVKSAIKNSGYAFPARRITVNLAPADIKKEGSSFDLPLAIGVLIAEGYIKRDNLDDFMFVGELSLDGSIRPVRGAISISMCARAEGRRLVIPAANAGEAAVVSGVEVYGARTLAELVEFFNGTGELERTVSSPEEYFGRVAPDDEAPDLSDVKGQEHVKRALEVAAAGGHNMIMIGPPGSGKTMISRRLPTILPDMTLDEALEATRVHSVAGTLGTSRALVTERPFRAPHHTISNVGLIGGGSIPRPGEVSLAHNGVLFLDEMPEFGKSVLEAMRQPLEDGHVNIVRAALSISYPASFMLVGAMNPCPCGFLGDPAKECCCSPSQIQRYRARLSGPLLDRIDIHCEVPAVRFRDLSDKRAGETSEAVRERVNAARGIQADRFRRKKTGGPYSNSRMTPREIRRHCEVDGESRRLLETAVERLGLSARAYSRILKVARTIADLDGEEKLKTAHISEAIQYRTLDRPVF